MWWNSEQNWREKWCNPPIKVNHVECSLQWSISIMPLMLFFFTTCFSILMVKLLGQLWNYYFSGPIGHQLCCCEKFSVVNYEPIDSSISEKSIQKEDRNLLSKDQQFLLNIPNAIMLGYCYGDIANPFPGSLSKSRWLTTAQWILRLYIIS